MAKRNCFGSSARIDCLPEEVITKILVHLPLRDAIATSRLSKAWRFRWISIPELVFSKSSKIQGQTPNQWINFINNVLLLHRGAITKIEIRYLSESACLYMDQWLALLWRKNLNDLMIGFEKHISYRCPSTLFCCQELRTLALQRCDLQLPLQIQFDGFKNLTRLLLSHVTMNKETIEFLVNNSPQLQNLAILQSGILSHLSISAPNLKKCRIWRCEGVTFIQMPKLQTVCLKQMLKIGVCERFKLDGILGQLVQVKYCRIYHPFTEFLSFENFWERVPIIYRHLKNVFFGLDFEDPKQILATIWLFRSSPKIEKLQIVVAPTKYHLPNEDSLMEEFYGTLDKRESIMQSLQIVEFMDFRGLTKEFRFIQFILLNANVLQTLKIKWKGDEPAGLDREGVALTKLQMFQRTSSRVEFALPGWEHNKR